MSGKRYLFFDNTNGEILINEARNRIEIMPTVDRVIEIYPTLSERNRETFDVLELPFGAYANDFREGRLIGVNLETKTPIFEYSNGTEEPIVPTEPFSVTIDSLGQQLVAKDIQIMQLENELDFVGMSLVSKDFEVMELQSTNESLGQQVVDHDIRLMMGGL